MLANALKEMTGTATVAAAKVRVVDRGQYVREKQADAKWRKYQSYISEAKQIIAERGYDAGISFLSKTLNCGAEWLNLPYDWMKLNAVYAADNNDPMYDDSRQPYAVSDFVNFNYAGACFQSRRNTLQELLGKAFAKGKSVGLIGSGSAKPEQSALYDFGDNPTAKLTCIDKSPEALQNIQASANEFGLEKQVVVCNEDALMPDWRIKVPFDITVSVGFAGNYLRGAYLSGMLQKLLAGTKYGGSVIVDICYPDTELIDYIGNVLQWSVASIVGKGLQTMTQDEFLSHLSGDFDVTFYDYVYGAICVISK